jgi:hypothetical protein
VSPHGTNARYSRGCHCKDCCDAHAQYAREYTRGETRTVDAAPIRTWLRAQPYGITMVDIAERTGVSVDKLRYIRAGKVERTSRRVAEALEPWMNGVPR